MTKSTASNDTINDKPRILYLDTAYTIKMVKERDLGQEVNSRDCGGFFGHVWGVHPIADIPEKRKLDYSGFKILVYEFSENQTIIEGLSAYYSFLRYCYPLNFLISQFRFVYHLISIVKREKISIILSTDPYLGGIIGLLIRWFTGARLVIWVIANYDDMFKATGIPAMPRLFRRRWIEKIVEKFVFRKADLVAGGNQDNYEFAIRNGGGVDKSTVFPVGKLIHRSHCIDPKLRENDKLFLSRKALYNFVFVGRLDEVKHPDDVLRAFSAISRKASSCELIIAGDGPMRDSLEMLAAELGIKDKVHFLGNVDQKRLTKLLAGCFAVLSPLTGRSLVEAALAGVPIVAYDRDWQRDFLRKSGAGIIVPFRDWQKMGEAAVHLIENPGEAKQIGAAARRKGLDFCDLDKIYGHEQMEFEKILKR